MEKILLRDLIKYAPSKFLPAVSGFITIPILTRLFPPEEYGLYVLAVSLSSLLYAVSCSGFGSAAVRFYSEYENKLELGNYFISLNINLIIVISLTSICTFTVLLLIKNFISPPLYHLLRIGILVFIAESIFITYLQISRAKQMSGTYTIFDLIFRYGSLGSGLFLILFIGFRIDGLLWGNLLCLLFLLPILLYAMTKETSIRCRNFPLQDSYKMLRYAWPLGLGNMAMWTLNLSDRYIIGLYLPGKELGLYSIGYQISEKTISIIGALFLLSMGPLIINTWESQGRQKAEEAVATVTRLFLIFCLPAVIGLTILASPIIKILTTEAYFEGHRIIGYVAFSGLFLGLCQISQTILIVGKKTRILALNQFVAAAVNLGLNFILVPKFGYTAAGVTTLISFILLFILQTYQSREQLRWFFPFKTLKNVSLASSIMGVCAFQIMQFASSTKACQLSFIFITVTLSMLIYFGCLFLLGETNKEELATMGIFRKQMIT